MGTNGISGGFVWLLLLGTHCTVILGTPSTGHGYETKSFAQAYLECLQYLNITRQSMYAYDTTAVPTNTGGNCLLRCIGLNTRWWSDETGLNEKALVRFFRQTDPKSLEQARTCLATVSNSSGTCDAAYRTFRCYSDALGEVIAHPEYVAPCREEIRRAVSDCATMLQVSDGQLASCVGAETFLHDGNSAALLRCAVLRLGLYADSTGVMSDRLVLLMDGDTAQSWTEGHVEEAKRCEHDLRELNTDVCVVAAHSVEICYGWRTFGALWKVLREEFGKSDDVIVSERVDEPLVESKDVEKVEQEEKEKKEDEEEKEEEEKKQDQPNNAVYPVSDEVEVFSYPSSPRYRSLLIVAPKWIAATSDSDSSSSQDDSTPEDDKLEAVELEGLDTEKSANPENAVKKEQKPEAEESIQKDSETYHVVHTRSVMYPMTSEVFPHCRPVLPPYVSRMRRSNPLPHYYPHDIPMMANHYFHPMSHPVVKRSLPMEPVFAPAYRHFVPVRFAREVVVPATDGLTLETVPEGSQGQQDQLVPLFDTDSTGMQEDLSKDDEIEDETLGDEEKGDAYKDNTYVADATLNEGENQDAEVSKAGETIPTDGAGATPNEGNGHANEEQAVAVSTADETSFVDVPVQNDENGPAPEVFEQPAPSDNDAYLPTIVDEGTIVGETETEAKTLDSSAMPQTNSAADASDVDETKASASEANIPPKLLTPATSADNSAPLAQPESSNVVPSAENVPNQTPAQKGLHPQLVERLVRVARTANMIKNILSVLTKH